MHLENAAKTILKLTTHKLTNKTILIVSPQAWGKMFVSKHHFAIELARAGNTVFFLNPPEVFQSKDKIVIEPSGVHENLFLVSHQLWFPYNIKFHFINLFHLLMRPHIKKILGRIGRPVDIVWSFDLGNLYPFRFFPASSYKIFHPVDEPLNQTAIDSARGSQMIFSVTREILDKYEKFQVPRYLINQGISEVFLQPINPNSRGNDPIHVGLSGNLLRADIDRATLLQIMRDHPGITFECWGSYSIKQSNIGGADDQGTINFIDDLKKLKNVVLHGTVSSESLAKAIHRMDAFLVCYDVEKDQSKGTNYHKIMEYLGTGKVIVSNNISAYKDHPELVQMVAERDNNSKLPRLFDEIMNSLNEYNSIGMQAKRIAFAEDNTYQKQVARIAEKIYG